jgi:hypothetical protein
VIKALVWRLGRGSCYAIKLPSSGLVSQEPQSAGNCFIRAFLNLIPAIITYMLQFIATVCALASSAKSTHLTKVRMLRVAREVDERTVEPPARNRRWTVVPGIANCARGCGSRYTKS